MNPIEWMRFGRACLGKRPWAAWLDRAERAVSPEGAERLSADFPCLWEADLSDAQKVNHNARKAKARQACETGPRLIHWLVPDFSAASGGHQTVLRFIRYLQAKNVENHVFVMPKSVHAEKLSEFVAKHFGETGAHFHPSPEGMGAADIFFATNWETAYRGFNQHEPLFKAYFIQDYEPLFYPAGAFRQFAENSYRLGYYGCCASPWLARIAAQHGMQAASFLLGYDPKEFYPEPGITRKRETVAAYVRPATERRGLEMLLGALKILQRQRPEIRIKLFGSKSLMERRLPFIAENLGILDTAGMRRLFSESELLLLCSFSNYSLLPQEALACGCRVLDVDVESTREVFGQDGPVALAQPYPMGIARKAGQLLDSRDGRDEHRARAGRWLADKTWEQVFDRLWSSLRAAWKGKEE